ncbi:hypothetical protein [Erysipelothrix piscisicarius]|nr:hypothetical protein [Erysipelothrix piscisicarius]
MPSWGADLSKVDFDEYIYFLRASDQVERTWRMFLKKFAIL